jgi:hypothetical protein
MFVGIVDKRVDKGRNLYTTFFAYSEDWNGRNQGY